MKTIKERKKLHYFILELNRLYGTRKKIETTRTTTKIYEN
jgi:hypothetical protein